MGGFDLSTPEGFASYWRAVSSDEIVTDLSVYSDQILVQSMPVGIGPAKHNIRLTPDPSQTEVASGTLHILHTGRSGEQIVTSFALTQQKSGVLN